MAIKYCIFDVGQVCYPYSLDPLNNYCAKHTKNEEEFVKKHGVKSFDYNPFMKGEVSFDQFSKDLCEHCGMVYSEKHKLAFNREMHRGVGAFIEQTIKAMNSLEKQKIEVCLLSNALPNLSDTGPDNVKPENTFASFTMGLLKPDVMIFKEVLKKLGAKPEEVIFVDDKPANVNAASSIGIHGIVFDKKTINREIKKIIKENKEYDRSLKPQKAQICRKNVIFNAISRSSNQTR